MKTVTLLTFLLLCLAPAAFAKNDEAPVNQDDEFHFIVLGDAQFDDPVAFNRIIDQTARLSPAFVVQVGDLIDGYTSDLDVIRSEWQRFQAQTAPLGDIPYYAVAGNHDVYGGDKKPDPALEDLFEDTWGPLYFSFTYKNTLLIGLNSDDHTSPGRISDEQIEWMKRILKKSDAEHRFVFMHRPPMLMKNAGVLHQAFVKGGVSQVIYGHHHHLHHFKRDGVSYTMTNAGGTMAHRVKAVGGFPHLLHVAIRAEDLTVAVIEADAVHSQDMVTPVDNYDLFALGRALAPEEVQLIPVTKSRHPRHYALSIDLENPAERDITAYVACTSADNRWLFDPTAIAPIDIPSKDKHTLKIKAQFEPNRAPESLPQCSVQVPFQTAGGEWLEFEQVISTRY